MRMNVMLQTYHMAKSTLSNPCNELSQSPYVATSTTHFLFSVHFAHFHQQALSSFLTVLINAAVRRQFTEALHYVLSFLLHTIFNVTHGVGAQRTSQTG